MNIASVLYSLIISPIEIVIEAIFAAVLNNFSAWGAVGAIVAVSLAVNFLTLPIYNMADRIQKKERDKQKSMAHWVTHIKKHFTGDERFMMLQAYYRICHYHPLYALRSSLSIMIEVPFFIAAYHFLSHCPALQEASYGILRDLGKPDGLIAMSAIGGGG